MNIKTVLYPIVSTCTIQFTDRRGETEWIGGGGEAGVPFYLLRWEKIQVGNGVKIAKIEEK